MEWIPEADGVFRGGGVKGLGLAGALLGFAEHPTKPVTRWVNVAGASAGAIIASYLATGHSAQAMQTLLDHTRYDKLKDFGPLGPLAALPNLLLRHGACRGRYFEDWFNEQLAQQTFAAVKTQDGQRSRLKLITVDVENREMLVLPDDLLDADGRPRYLDPRTGKEIVPDELEIARAARMSMSIPYFFEPVRLRRADGGEALFVDGGTLSNFPVWLFDVSDRPPARPTFGFTLSGGKDVGAGAATLARHLPWALRFGWDIFETATEAWDKRFQAHSTRVRTCVVDAGTIGTTDFKLSPAQRAWLIESGRKAARAFLDQFDPELYLNTFGRSLARAPATASAPA